MTYLKADAEAEISGGSGELSSSASGSYGGGGLER